MIELDVEQQPLQEVGRICHRELYLFPDGDGPAKVFKKGADTGYAIVSPPGVGIPMNIASQLEDPSKPFFVSREWQLPDQIWVLYQEIK